VFTRRPCIRVDALGALTRQKRRVRARLPRGVTKCWYSRSSIHAIQRGERDMPRATAAGASGLIAHF